jgi:hypothetical protein
VNDRGADFRVQDSSLALAGVWVPGLVLGQAGSKQR